MNKGKKISVILFFILGLFLFSVYATKITADWRNVKNCGKYCAELIANEVAVEGKNYSGVIIRARSNWRSEWTPTRNDIIKMEALLPSYVKELEKKEHLTDLEERFLRVWPVLASYKRFWRGAGADGGGLYIDVTFFSSEMAAANNGPGPFPNWRCPNYQIFDGAAKKFGDKAYFRMNFYVKDKKFYCQY